MNKLSICIAEDSKVVRNAISSLLANSGYFEVCGAGVNGREAVDLCRDNRPRIALLDVSMPEMNGIEAARQICAISPDTVVIMLSSHDEMEVIREALKAGARDFIRKPVHGPELIQKILTIYNREGSRRQVSTDTGRRKILGFMGPKTGTGATTIACNSAVLMARKLNKRVMIIDLDFIYGDVSHCLGGRRQQTMVDLLGEENSHHMQTIEKFVTRTNSGVHLLAGPASPSPESLLHESLATIIRSVEPSYDYVIVDFQATHDESWNRIVGATDQLLLVLSNDVPCIRSGKVCLEALKKINYAARKIKVVYNHVTPDGGVDRKDLQDFINFPVFAEVTNDRETVTKAYLARSPFVGKADTQIVQDIDRFVDRLFSAKDRI